MACIHVAGPFAKAFCHWGLHAAGCSPFFCNPCWHGDVKHMLRQSLFSVGISARRGYEMPVFNAEDAESAEKIRFNVYALIAFVVVS